MYCCCNQKFLYRKSIKNKEEYPSRTSMERMINDFLEYGNVNVKRASSKRRSNEDIEEICSVIENSSSSCRSMSALTGVSKSKVHNILRENMQLTPYKMHIARHLAQHTREERFEFCHKFLESSNDVDFNETFCSQMREATFDLNRVCNKQNCRIWSPEKPESSCFKKTNFPKKQIVWIVFFQKSGHWLFFLFMERFFRVIL